MIDDLPAMLDITDGGGQEVSARIHTHTLTQAESCSNERTRTRTHMHTHTHAHTNTDTHNPHHIRTHFLLLVQDYLYIT